MLEINWDYIKLKYDKELEHCSHVWGAVAQTTLALLDSVEKSAIHFINDPDITRN